MQAVSKTIQQVLHSPDRYIVPVFQRYYSWEDDNWEKLWNDLLYIQLDPTLNRRHFMGSIVCVSFGHQPTVLPAWLMIDGQQRLLTITVFLAALRDHALSNGFTTLAEEIETNHLIHRLKQNEERFKVWPRLQDRDSYQSIIQHNIDSSCNSLLAQAYRYFRSCFIKLEDQSETHK